MLSSDEPCIIGLGTDLLCLDMVGSPRVSAALYDVNVN